MKKIIILYSLFVSFLTVFYGQTFTSLTILSSSNRDFFTLTLNGTTINDIPSKNVFVDSLTNSYVEVIINFKDSSIPTILIDKLQISQPDNEDDYYSCIYVIDIDRLGRRKVRFSGSRKITNDLHTIQTNNESIMIIEDSVFSK